MQGSDAPVSAIEPYVGNPAGNVFQEAPANGGELLETPVVPQPVAAPEQVSPPAAPVTDATAREITPPSPPAIETPERAPSNLAPTASNATSEVPLPPVNTTITEPIPQTPPPAAMPPPMMPTQPMMPVPQQSAPTNNVPSQENPNLDSDGLNDFDNGGESETNEEKFDVSAPLSSPYIVVSTASYASVGQATPTELEGSANPAMTSPVRTTKRIKELELHEAPLAEFLDAVTAETNLSFIYSPEVGQRKINVSLRDIGWEEALKAVLVSNRLDMENQGRVRRVDTLENLATAADAKRQAQRNIDALTNTKLLVLRLNYAKAATIKATISSILASSGTTDQRVKVESDDRTNTLIVQAIDSDLRKVKTLVERLDLQTPQVKIATRIVEVSNTLDNFLGIGWNGAYNGDSSAGLGFGTLPFPNSVAADYSVDPGVLTGGGRVGSTGFRIGGIQGITDLDLRLKMEEKRSNAQILYSNSVSVEDNQAATFKAGTEEVFIVQGIGTGASGSTQTITYNMTLNVTPHITADNAVQMTLDIQSDDPLKPNSAAATGKTTRGVNTKLIKKNGETAVLGGMYRTSKSVSEDGVPWLSKIPIVGALFRANSSTNSQRETLIMVTPTILNTPGSAASGGPATADFPSSIQNSAPVTTNINNMTNNIEMNNTGAPVNSTKTALNAPLPDDGSNALESEIDVDNAANPE
jgi:type IV pilus secretin PilQ/predicted competence protein